MTKAVSWTLSSRYASTQITASRSMAQQCFGWCQTNTKTGRQTGDTWLTDTKLLWWQLERVEDRRKMKLPFPARVFHTPGHKFVDLLPKTVSHQVFQQGDEGKREGDHEGTYVSVKQKCNNNNNKSNLNSAVQFNTNSILTVLYIVIKYIQRQYMHIWTYMKLSYSYTCTCWHIPAYTNT